jgi:phage-related protein
MPLPLFDPPVEPNVGLSRSRSYRVKAAGFGDGYSQRTGIGLNNQVDQLRVAWSKLEQEEADAIEEFLDERAGFGAFRWAPPNMSETKWVCQQWDRNAETGLLTDIEATFIRVYDLE